MGSALGRPASSRKIEAPISRPNAVSISSLDCSPFRLLPNELILHITFFLPRDAIAALALTCKPLCLVLPRRSFRLPWENKLNFIRLLERDLPGHIVCRHCTKLHAIEKAELYLLARTMQSPYSSCRWEQMWSKIDWYFHKGFSIVIFEMAAKQHRQKVDCSKLLELLSSEARIHQREDHVERHSALVRVVDGCFIIREQRVCFMPKGIQEPLPPKARFLICPHFTISMSSMERLNQVADQFERPPKSSDGQAHPACPGLIPCRYCHTDFQMDFRSFGDAGNGVSISTWKDVGSSLLDDKWRGHIGIEVDMVPFDRGSICAAFEDKDFSLVKPDWPLDSEVRKILSKGKSSGRRKMFR